MANKYAGTQTEKNLMAAFSGESEARNKYTYFASKAKNEARNRVPAFDFLYFISYCLSVYLLIILLCPFIFDGPISIVLIPLVLALFEGFIHTAGIVIHQLKKPYSPGMITAWIMFIYATVMIRRLNMQIELNTMDWILGIVLFLITFLIMETQFVKTVGITIREFQTSMKKYMIGRIKRNR